MILTLRRYSFFAASVLLAATICLSSCSAQEKKITQDEFNAATRAAWGASGGTFPSIQSNESSAKDITKKYDKRSISDVQYSLSMIVTTNGETHVTDFIRIGEKRFQRVDKGDWQVVINDPDLSGTRAEPAEFIYFLTDSNESGENVKIYRREAAGGGPTSFNETIKVDSKGRVVSESYSSAYGNGSIKYQFPEKIESITEPTAAQ